MTLGEVHDAVAGLWRLEEEDTDEYTDIGPVGETGRVLERPAVPAPRAEVRFDEIMGGCRS